MRSRERALELRAERIELELDPKLGRTSRASLTVGFVGIALFAWGASHMLGELAVFAVTCGLTLLVGALAWGATAR